MAIADEVDPQLAQQMASYIAESKTGDQPIDTWKGSEGQRQVA
jgi:hypothetical protein